MKRVLFILITVLIAVLICGQASARADYDARIGMTREEIRELFSGYEEENSSETTVTYRSDSGEIRLVFNQESVDFMHLQAAGADRSGLDLFLPDWSVTYAGLISSLAGNSIGFECYAYQLSFPVYGSDITYSVSFKGVMNDYPVRYACLFDKEGRLAEVSVSDEDLSVDMKEAACMIFGAVQILGAPEESLRETETEVFEDELTDYITETLFWETDVNAYEHAFCSTIAARARISSPSLSPQRGEELEASFLRSDRRKA